MADGYSELISLDDVASYLATDEISSEEFPNFIKAVKAQFAHYDVMNEIDRMDRTLLLDVDRAVFVNSDVTDIYEAVDDDLETHEINGITRFTPLVIVEIEMGLDIPIVYCTTHESYDDYHYGDITPSEYSASIIDIPFHDIIIDELAIKNIHLFHNSLVDLDSV